MKRKAKKAAKIGIKKTVAKKRVIAKKRAATKRRVYYRLPAVLVELGKALEIGLDNGQSIKFRGGFMLASNVDGDRLFVLPITNKRSSAGATGNKGIIAQARKLYRRFTDFESSKSYKVKLTDHILKKLGGALFIAYRSDKWSGQNVDYIHRFDKKTECWADDENEKDATIFAMRGSIAVKKEGITG